MKRVDFKILCSLIFSLFITISCQQTTTPTKNENGNPEHEINDDTYPHSELTDERYVDSVLSLLDLGSAVIPNGNIVEIQLPKCVSDYSKASILWTASEPSAFTVSGYTGYVTEPSDSQVSIVTATVSKGTATKTKDFPVKIISKNQTSISDEDYIQGAKSLLEMGVFKETGGSLETRLFISQISGIPQTSNHQDSNGTIFSYDASTLPAGSYINEFYGVLSTYGEIVNRVYSLDVIMTKNSATTKKTLYFTPPVLSSFVIVNGANGGHTYNGIECTNTKTIDISNNQLKRFCRYISNSDQSVCCEEGDLYNISIDPEQRKLKASLCEVCYKGEWLTLEELKSKKYFPDAGVDTYFNVRQNIAIDYQVTYKQDDGGFQFWMTMKYKKADGEEQDLCDF